MITNKPQYSIFLFVILISLNNNNLIAQILKSKIENFNNNYDTNANISDVIITKCSGTSIPNYQNNPVLTNIKNLEKKHIFSPEIEKLKSIKTNNKIQNQSNKNYITLNDREEIANISLGTNFKGNVFNGGAPPDNTIAIAENGNIVSAINCNIAYYNNLGNQLWTGSFWELYNDSELTELIYDPIVMYDTQIDRFVMITIHGFSSTKSKLILSFSKSNNPLDGWWTYNLSGNPLNNNCWLDYPKLGISNNEIFITGNLFGDNSGFSESVIYQIAKNNGFNGEKLEWRLWSNIVGSPLTLIPTSYGQKGNYGPGLYFLNQSPASGNSVNLYEITNDLNSKPQIKRNTIFKSDYEPSGNAEQLGSNVKLITSDCRILSSFYLDSIIHYVFQSDYQNTNFSGINYNRLNVEKLTNQSYSYGQIGFDCAYPSVASYSNSQSDKSVIFCFLRSGKSIYPETRVVMFDDNLKWSNSLLIKQGENYVDAFAFDDFVRWGDYTGIVNRFSQNNNEIWLSGCYGSKQNLFNINYNCFNTWIAQINSTPNSVNDRNEDLNQKQKNMKMYPNPVIDLYNIDFYLDNSCEIKIEIIDLNGNLVSLLFNGSIRKGKNLLTFNKGFLSKGSYVVMIKNELNTLFSEKIIIE